MFQCPRCLEKVSLYDCGDDQAQTASGKGKTVKVCPNCRAKGLTEVIDHRAKSSAKPGQGGLPLRERMSAGREEREHDDRPQKRRSSRDMTSARSGKSSHRTIPHWYPPHKMMNFEDDSLPWGAKWREDSNFRTVAELFTKRNLWALATIRPAITKIRMWRSVSPDVGLTGITLNSSKMYKERESGRGISSGTYYVPQVSREMVVTNGYDYKVETQLIPAFVGAGRD